VYEVANFALPTPVVKAVARKNALTQKFWAVDLVEVVVLNITGNVVGSND
jgi:hypothetical protein